MDVREVMQALEKNRMVPHCVDRKEDVVPFLRERIPAGAAVGCGGSVTLDQCGVREFLRGGGYRFYDREGNLADGDALLLEKQTDVYLTSTNALTRDGVLYNVDGRGNRVSCIAHGPKSVIVVAGINKLVNSLDEAVDRVKRIAAPLNCRRLGYTTYCAQKGCCQSLAAGRGGLAAMTEGCGSETRICAQYLASAMQRVPGRIHVLLVGEALGY